VPRVTIWCRHDDLETLIAQATIKRQAIRYAVNPMQVLASVALDVTQKLREVMDIERVEKSSP
jgi:hypothetical protein